MMFLQYFVQGSYLPVVSVYAEHALGFDARQIGFFGAALAVGPIFAPFVLGHVVDRWFATERVMAFCHFTAGLLMLWLFVETRVWAVILVGTVYSVLYVPTMMLSNSLAFQHLRDTDLEFPWVRAFGTLGFIAPAFLVEFWLLGEWSEFAGEEPQVARRVVFALAGITGMVMALYCLSLPHTPPRQQADLQRSYAPGAIVGLLQQRDFLVLVVVSFFIGIAHQFFFVWNSVFLREVLDSGGIHGAYEQSIASIGQICELGVMAVLGLLLKRFGYKWTMTLGALAYTLRCVLLGSLFLFEPFAMRMAIAATGQALHGFCFGCFLAVSYIYVDRVAPPDARGSMQMLYGTCILALSFFVGGFVSGEVGSWFTFNGSRDWMRIWLTCGGLAGLCTLALVVLFPDRRLTARPTTT
jgi:nucleoside transporter